MNDPVARRGVPRMAAAGVRLLRRLVTLLVVLFFSYMLIVILLQIAGRYVFGFSIDWTAETATFAQIWMILLASGLAMRDNLHVSVDALADLLPATWARGMTVVVAAACTWFLWQAVSGSIDLLAIGRLQNSPVLQMPMWIAYLSLPIGLLYFWLELCIALWRRFRNKPGTSTP